MKHFFHNINTDRSCKKLFQDLTFSAFSKVKKLSSKVLKTSKIKKDNNIFPKF